MLPPVVFHQVMSCSTDIFWQLYTEHDGLMGNHHAIHHLPPWIFLVHELFSFFDTVLKTWSSLSLFLQYFQHLALTLQAQVPIYGWLMAIPWCVTLSGCRGWLLRCSNHFLYGDIGLLQGCREMCGNYFAFSKITQSPALGRVRLIARKMLYVNCVGLCYM